MIEAIATSLKNVVRGCGEADDAADPDEDESGLSPRVRGSPGHGQVDDEQASSAAIDALVQFSELGTGRVSPDPDCLAPHQVG